MSRAWSCESSSACHVERFKKLRVYIYIYICMCVCVCVCVQFAKRRGVGFERWRVSRAPEAFSRCLFRRRCAGAAGTRHTSNTAVERAWHTYDSQGRILALAVWLKPLNLHKLFDSRSAAAPGAFSRGLFRRRCAEAAGTRHTPAPLSSRGPPRLRTTPCRFMYIFIYTYIYTPAPVASRGPPRR